ncbi:MAG TPA: N-acetylmuramoyl-L-alanine amidase [Chloroflexota bacterium]|nr:N-acetylmuramoyl-L-alanine amidase [Chloroflexota bacterium]
MLRGRAPTTLVCALSALGVALLLVTLASPGSPGAEAAPALQATGATSTIGPTLAPSRTPTPAGLAPTSTLAPRTPTRTPAPAPTGGATSTLGPTRTPTPGPSPTTQPSATGTFLPTSSPTITPTRTAGPSPTATATLPPFAIAGRPLDGWVIALDPGHGGRDPGAAYHGVFEKEVNLAITLLARPLLEQAGARVVLTRDRDTLVGPADGTITEDLEARAQIANRAGAHLFVSVHANVHTDDDVTGAITFYGVEFGYAGGQRRADRQVELSWLLAGAVQRGVVARTREIDRGVRSANFWVLGATRMPSVLLESGFLTNEDEARNLADPTFRRRIAEGIALGVIDYATGGQVLPTDRVPAIVGDPLVRYYDQTGHNLAYGFRTFFDTHGGLDIFGYPRTEEIQEGGFTVQYLQRARFEYHPEHAGTPYEVQLGLLGDLTTTSRRPFPFGVPFVPGDDHRWYIETGHGLHYGFLRYFDTRGGLDVFGYPISEELQENGFTVQYFQRARFEYHPEHAGTPYEVELGLLGDQLLQQHRWLR